MQCSAEAGHGVVAYAAQALLERATQAADAAEPGLKHGGCRHILPPSVAAIALKLFPMTPLSFLSPPSRVVLDALASPSLLLLLPPPPPISCSFVFAGDE